MLIAGAQGEPPRDATIVEFPDLVGPGDVIVVNDSRVLHARLQLAKATGGNVEVFLLHPAGGDGSWDALVRPSRRVRPQTELFAGDSDAPVLVVNDDLGEGRRRVMAIGSRSITELAAALGSVPLPPYIGERLDDPERYQTVYSRRPVSVAAPTAGLHFTPEVLAQCREAGAEIVQIELAVGLGTFRPIVAEDVGGHSMHEERYQISDAAWQKVTGAERVVAIGTTSVRALESAAASGQLNGSTDLFITPGYRWQVVDALLTNFHLPKSSLLVMLSAFVGDGWRDLYEAALARNYRFLSFGDAMFVQRNNGDEVDAEEERSR